MNRPRNSLLSSWALTAVPIGILIAPLFFHRSDVAEIGSYSASYFGMLKAVWCW